MAKLDSEKENSLWLFLEQSINLGDCPNSLSVLCELLSDLTSA